ncbi:MAG: SirB2 family protein [Alcanivoracaceae bacterium]|nr:SirB2 family protein [Alcanivoracaceae bacterium]
MYTELKYAHILFVSISILLFQYRFYLQLFNKPISKLLKVTPHINDTLLLISAISLAYIAGFNPLQQPWLSAKIIALLFYIAFGMLALKSSGTKSILAYVLATLTYVFIILTALNKTPYFGL